MNDKVFNYIQPGKSTKNAYIERFSQTLRRHILDVYTFGSLGELSQEIEVRMRDYNFVRPHISLGGMSPIDYRIKNKTHILEFFSLHYTQPKMW